jgi:hypothetical protein
MQTLLLTILNASLVILPVVGGSPQTVHLDDRILKTLEANQYDLLGPGRSFLFEQAASNDYFLLGELHGDNEIPALLKTIWPEMWKQGYRHISAEVSPWAAHQLEHSPADRKVIGLWTIEEAAFVHSIGQGTTVLWGCDIEEAQPQALVRELAKVNPDDPNLQQMVRLTKGGYQRNLAPELLRLAKESLGRKDEIFNDISLRQNLLATLQVEKDRLAPETRTTASDERERLMKEQFLQHFRHASTGGPSFKVLLRFGRNHLHRGNDARGVSTLGNFIVEFAVSQGKKAFNVGAFGAGGQGFLVSTFDADERQDELAFALLAENAKYSATIFDLRPLRLLLHGISPEKRSPLETNLIYWADSYDALICYKAVTPLMR